jgi:sialate O-acetylesterase
MKAGDSSYVDDIKSEFVGARTVEGKTQQINEIDLYRIPCYMINGESADEMISLVKKAMETNGLIVFLFHGVGGEHPLNVSLNEHNTLLRFIKHNEKNIWIAPMVDIAAFIKKNNGNK